MKGIETKAILGIILLILLLILIVGIFIYPAMGTQKQTNQEIDFRLYCFYWRQKQYQYNPQLQTPDTGEAIDMNAACTKELGMSCLVNYPDCMANNGDWDKCIAACKLVNSTSA